MLVHCTQARQLDRFRGIKQYISLQLLSYIYFFRNIFLSISLFFLRKILGIIYSGDWCISKLNRECRECAIDKKTYRLYQKTYPSWNLYFQFPCTAIAPPLPLPTSPGVLVSTVTLALGLLKFWRARLQRKKTRIKPKAQNYRNKQNRRIVVQYEINLTWK